MTVLIFVPCIVLCVLFTIITFVMDKANPLAGLHNMPPAIQERVHSLTEYRYQAPPVLSTKQRLMKKLPALLIVLLLLFVITRKLGAHDFVSGFTDVFIIWVVIKLWVSLVLDCGWLAHDRKRWIPGTEDMVEAYQDYGFWLSSIPRSILVGALAAAILGLICQFVPIYF